MAYYYGCWAKEQTGHFLFDEQGRVLPSQKKVDELPLDLQPKYLDSPPATGQSKVNLAHIEGYSVISMKDGSADSRGGSHAKFIISGTYSIEEMVQLFHKHFPLQAQRISSFKPFSW